LGRGLALRGGRQGVPGAEGNRRGGPGLLRGQGGRPAAGSDRAGLRCPCSVQVHRLRERHDPEPLWPTAHLPPPRAKSPDAAPSDPGRRDDQQLLANLLRVRRRQPPRPDRLLRPAPPLPPPADVSLPFPGCVTSGASSATMLLAYLAQTSA